METRRLEYFVRIVDAGSISRAAQDLGLAQPALSQQLAIIEQDVKATLLHRSRQGVAPTAAGRQFYRQARVILRQVEEARALVRAAEESLAGTVSVGFPNGAAAILCLPLIERLTAGHPQIDLQIVEGYSANLTDMTGRGQLDIAVLYQDSAPPGMDAISLWEEDLLLIGPPGAGMGDAVRRYLQGDASPRRYETARTPERAAILMNAPALDIPGAADGTESYADIVHLAQDMHAVVAVGEALRAHGFSAPETLAADLPAGLLLQEDLGRGMIVEAGAPVPERYEAAVDLLADLHEAGIGPSLPLPGVPGGGSYQVPAYDERALLTEAELFLDWYLPSRGVTVTPAFVSFCNSLSSFFRRPRSAMARRGRAAVAATAGLACDSCDLWLAQVTAASARAGAAAIAERRVARLKYANLREQAAGGATVCANGPTFALLTCLLVS